MAPVKTMNLCLDTSRRGIKLQTLSAKHFFELGAQVFVHPVHFEFYQLAVEHFKQHLLNPYVPEIPFAIGHWLRLASIFKSTISSMTNYPRFFYF